MLKKFIVFFVILIISFSLSNVGHATDILMNLNTYAPTNITDTSDNRTQNSDNTIYSAEVNLSGTENTISDYQEVSTTTSSDYDETTDLSISNIINIVLIAVGIVLILLGIAIIIKLK